MSGSVKPSLADCQFWPSSSLTRIPATSMPAKRRPPLSLSLRQYPRAGRKIRVRREGATDGALTHAR